jgi:transposase-like protein
VGGMAQRDLAGALETARGQCVLSTSALSPMTETRSQAYEACCTRDLRGYEVASLFLDTGYAPFRRGGRQTGGLCVWGSCVAGRKVLLTLSPTNRASGESCRDVLRALTRRGLQPPGTITTAGAPGLIKAVDFVWPRSLRIRWGRHKRQNVRQNVPPQAWPACKALVVEMREAPPRVRRDTVVSIRDSSSLRTPSRQRVAVWPPMPRPVCLPCRGPRGIGSLGAPQTGRRGPVRRSAAGPT